MTDLAARVRLYAGVAARLSSTTGLPVFYSSRAIYIDSSVRTALRCRVSSQAASLPFSPSHSLSVTIALAWPPASCHPCGRASRKLAAVLCLRAVRLQGQRRVRQGGHVKPGPPRHRTNGIQKRYVCTGCVCCSCIVCPDGLLRFCALRWGSCVCVCIAASTFFRGGCRVFLFVFGCGRWWIRRVLAAQARVSKMRPAPPAAAAMRSDSVLALFVCSTAGIRWRASTQFALCIPSPTSMALVVFQAQRMLRQYAL